MGQHPILNSTRRHLQHHLCCWWWWSSAIWIREATISVLLPVFQHSSSSTWLLVVGDQRTQLYNDDIVAIISPSIVHTYNVHIPTLPPSNQSEPTSYRQRTPLTTTKPPQKHIKAASHAIQFYNQSVRCWIREKDIAMHHHDNKIIIIINRTTDAQFACRNLSSIMHGCRITYCVRTTSNHTAGHGLGK